MTVCLSVSLCECVFVCVCVCVRVYVSLSPSISMCVCSTQQRKVSTFIDERRYFELKFNFTFTQEQL